MFRERKKERKPKKSQAEKVIFVWRHFLCHSKASTMYVIDLERWNSCRCLNSSTYYLLLLFCCSALCVHDVVIGKKCEFIPMPKECVRYRLMSNRRSQFRDHTVDNFVSPFCVISSDFASRLCALLKVSVKKISVEFGTNFSF